MDDQREQQTADVKIIINGTDYGSRPFPEDITLRGLLEKALGDTKNTGQPPENWEVRDANGNVLNLDKRLSDCDDLDQVWITLKAGEGG